MSCEGKQCREVLANAIDAYNRILMGDHVVEVTLDEETTRYSKQEGGAQELKALIRRLHETCGNELSAAIAGVPVDGRRARGLCYGDSSSHYGRGFGRR